MAKMKFVKPKPYNGTTSAASKVKMVLHCVFLFQYVPRWNYEFNHLYKIKFPRFWKDTH